MPEEKKHSSKGFSIELTPSVSILVAGVLIAGAIIFVNQHPSAVPAVEAAAGQGQQQVQANAHVSAPTASDHIIGSPTAPIVLVEYSDFQCPFCQLIYPSLKQIVSESNGSIAWVMREFPLYQIHPNAMPGADAAECVAEQRGSDGFWKFADTVFTDQTKISPEFFAQVAQSIGVNPDTYAACVSSHKYASKITAQTADAQASGGNGTPFTVVINTRTGKQYPISGALPLAQIKAVIEQAKASQ